MQGMTLKRQSEIKGRHVVQLEQPNYKDFTWGQWLDFNLIVNCVKLYLAKVIVYNKTTVHRS